MRENVDEFGDCETPPPPICVDIIEVSTSMNTPQFAESQQQSPLDCDRDDQQQQTKRINSATIISKQSGPLQSPKNRSRSSSSHNRGKILLKHKAWNRIRRSILGVNRSVWFYTILIIFNHFAFGICVNIIGATMVDLAFIYEVPLNTVSHMVLANNMGYTVGALAGYLYRWLNRQIMLVIFTMLIAITTYLMPYYGEVWAIITAITINGVGFGAWDAANTVWLVEMWPVGATTVLQIAQFGYGAGITLAPVLARNYVYGELNQTADNRTLTPEIRRDYLMVPYVESGALMTIAPIFFTILYFTNRYIEPNNSNRSEKQNNDNNSSAKMQTTRTTTKTQLNPISSKVDLVKRDQLTKDRMDDHQIDQSKSNSTITLESNVCDDLDESSVTRIKRNERSISWRNSKLLLCGLCLGTYFGSENGYFYYCTAMLQYIEVRLTAAEATQVTAVVSLAYTVGPLVTALVSLKLSPDIIISYHFAFLIAGIGTIYFMQANLIAIYVGSATLGYGFSAMIPAMNAFTERHLRFTDPVAAMFMFSSGFASLIIPFALGRGFEGNPQLLLYLASTLIGLSLAFFILIRLWITFSH